MGVLTDEELSRKFPVKAEVSKKNLATLDASNYTSLK